VWKFRDCESYSVGKKWAELVDGGVTYREGRGTKATCSDGGEIGRCMKTSSTKRGVEQLRGGKPATS